MRTHKEYIFTIIVWLIILAVSVMIGCAHACEGLHDTGIANTSVYVRSLETGEVIGSLQKGDAVTVVGRDKDWYKVEIAGNTYKVYTKYLELTDDDMQTMNKVRKSKSATVQNKKTYDIKGSDFDGLKLW